MKKTVLYPITLLFCGFLHMSIGLGASEPDIETKLQMIMERKRNRQPTAVVSISNEELKQANPQQVLSILQNYTNDEYWPVRRLAYLYQVRIAKLQPKPEIRQKVVKSLLEGLITGRSKQATKWLLTFGQEDFSEQSKALIREALAQANIGKVGGDPSIWLCGVANMKDQLPRLKELLINEVAYRSDPKMRHFPKWYYTSGWAARLARARMSVKEDIKRCVNLIEKEIDTNKNFRFLHNLEYIRQPEAIESLKKYFLSDLRLPPTNTGGLGEPFSNYLMPILADCLSNFPVKKRKARSYTKEEIELCRKWMSPQTTWQIIR